jgi:uncharacterized protein
MERIKGSATFVPRSVDQNEAMPEGSAALTTTDDLGPERAKEKAPFWRTTSLETMTDSEWESLCDGCGRCCLVKLEDEDTAEVHFTDVACALLDQGTCRCSDYPNRQKAIPDCVKLTPEVVRSINWLPPTCGYRIVAEGRDLPWWHPLVSGSFETVREAGVSVRDKVSASETDVPVDYLPGYIVSWPAKVPKRARGRGASSTSVNAPVLPRSRRQG